MRTFALPHMIAQAVQAAPDTSRAGGAGQVAEIVTFRLTQGSEAATLVAAANAMTPFLDSTGAFLSRTLSQNEDGLWTDHIVWTSLEAAQEAAAQMMQQPEAAPFMTLIDPDSVTMTHAPIHHRTD